MIDRDYIKSIEKGLNIISLLSQHGSPLKLEELVKISGVRKTSCFRILQTLTRAGFALKDKDTGGYFIGPKMIAIGLTALESRGIRQLALPFMKEIRKATGATVNLAILSGADVIFVERLQSAYIVEGNLSVGSRLSAHLSSMGKAILAHLPEADQSLEPVLVHLQRCPVLIERRTEPGRLGRRPGLADEPGEGRRVRGGQRAEVPVVRDGRRPSGGAAFRFGADTPVIVGSMVEAGDE